MNGLCHPTKRQTHIHTQYLGSGKDGRPYARHYMVSLFNKTWSQQSCLHEAEILAMISTILGSLACERMVHIKDGLQVLFLYHNG